MRGTVGVVFKCLDINLIVNMENDVMMVPEVAPMQDRLQDCIYFFKLNIT